jgi:prepilin-type N-terminal cleavage/methylation domain-containing protein
MASQLRKQDGFGLIELIAAMAVLSIALLALLAGYGSAVVSLRGSSQKTTASALADAQMELYRALPFASIGVDETAFDAADSTYTSDESDLNAALSNPADATDVTIANCVTTPQCLPVQTVTGTDHRSYRLETFVRDVVNNTAISYTIRIVTVIVRDPNVTGMPMIFTLTSGFDRGPVS